MIQLIITLIVSSLLLPLNAPAHSGRLNSEGCHQDKRNNELHCHGKEEKSNASSRIYSREKFGSSWDDEDTDCQNTRHEFLIEKSLTPVTFKTNSNCIVSSGTWVSNFTGKLIYKASEIDIDHIVPLKWAWDRGAMKWQKIKRISFANDYKNLAISEKSLNRQKGARGITSWLPPNNKCEYIKRFVDVANAYALVIPSHSNEILRSECDN